MNILANIGMTALRATGAVAKIGLWGAANQYTNEQFRNSSKSFIGEVERGAEHAGKNIKLIINNDK